MNPRNTELAAIRQVVDKYAEGCHTGNIALLRSIFHPQAMMYGAGGDNVLMTPIEGLYAYIEANEPPQKTGEPHQNMVTSIRYEGNAAVVETVQEAAYGNDYTNFFQLLKIEGQWLIVSKSYNAVPTKKEQQPITELHMQES
ncbi:MAG: hypothetical protein EOO04_15920 [Chitinophagaceae bacterium]|nr:MAG: hypothetical protein EOO04_15920 [Chitinophagaceae bacterium]